MNKKILAVLSLLIILASAAALHAADADNTIEVDNQKFNLPDGYKEDVSEEKINEKASVGPVEYTYCQKVFEKSPTEVFSILVATYDGYEVDDSVVSAAGGNKTTIDGIDGYLGYENHIYMFNYAKDGQLVTITYSDKEIISDII